MSKARELAELSRTVSDSADAVAITIDSNENVTFANDIDVTGTVTADALTVDTNTLVVDATNNRVGIGVTPVTTLDVKGASDLVASFRSSTNNGNTSEAKIRAVDSDSSHVATFLFQGYEHRFQNASGVENLRITSAGLVGIGSSSPSSPLEVAGGSAYPTTKISRDGGSAATQGYLTTGFSAIGYSGGTGADTYMVSEHGFGFAVNAGTSAMTITDGGLVSINTTLATELLNVANTAGNGAGAEFAGNGNTIGASSAFYGQGSGSDAYVWNRANSTVLLGTNNIERVRITNTGSARFNLSSTLSPESSSAYYPLFIGSSSQMSRNNHPDYYWMSNGYYAADATYRAITNGHMVGTYTTGNGDYVFRRSNASVNAGDTPAWVNSMTITADGVVQKHYHPAFNAYNPAVTSSGDIIICGATRLNQGNNFSTTTGAFTAPVAGVYHFTFAILVKGAGSPDYHRILFEINTSGTQTSYGDTLEEQAGSQYSSAVMSITIYLNQNAYIRIRNQGAETYGTNYGSFSGHLVG